MRIAVEIYNPETGEVVVRKYFTSSREFDKFKREYEEGRYRGYKWRIVGKSELRKMNEPLYAPIQTTIYGEKEKQRRFRAPAYRKPVAKVRKREKRKRTKPTILEKYGVEIREKGKPKLHDFGWRQFVDNVRRHDIIYMQEMKEELTKDDFARIWRDILEHEKLAREFAPEDEREEVYREFEEIKKRFHEIAGNDIYTIWDAEKVINYMTLSGIEYPAEPGYIMRTQKYSFNHVDVDVDCGEADRDTGIEEKREMLSRCADEVRKTIMCEYDTTFVDDGVPSSVAMWCEVNGRRVPVEFHLNLKEDWIREEWEIMY